MTRTRAYKLIVCLVVSLLLVLGLAACGGSGDAGATGGTVPGGSHVTEQENSGDNYGEKSEAVAILDGQDIGDICVMAIKDCAPPNYPDITIGEAFDWYFGSPAWRAFEGVTSDHDDTVDNVVEFTGICEYNGVDAEALIQFTFDPEFTEFETTYFELDGEPMTFRDLNALMEIAFYGYSEEVNE